MNTKDTDKSQEATAAGAKADDGKERTKDNPAECSVCFTLFDDTDRRPRTLPCGHTFCSKCITNMIETMNITCPSCRVNHEATSVDQFPISYVAEAFVKHFKTLTVLQPSRKSNTTEELAPSSENATSSKVSGNCEGDTLLAITRTLQKLLEDQKNRMKNEMEDQQEMQSQVEQYRTQLADWITQHTQLLDSLYDLVEQNKSALDLLKQEDSRVLAQMTKGQDVDKQMKTTVRSIESVTKAEEVHQVITQTDHCMDEAQGWKEKCQELFPDINTVTTSMKVRGIRWRSVRMVGGEVVAPEDTTQAMDAPLPIIDKVISIQKEHQLNVEDLQQLGPGFKKLVEAGKVFGFQENKDGHRYSRVSLENGQLHLHCLQKQPLPPGAFTLPLSEMVGTLNPSSTLTFLEMAWAGSTRGRVYIRLSPDTSWGRQFVLLCSGQRGPSYINTCLNTVFDKRTDDERVRGGDYEYNNGKGGASLLDHPRAQYRMSVKAGAVLFLDDKKLSAQFSITTRDRADEWVWRNVIGEVESGLEVVREAVRLGDITQATLVDCGVVMPR